MSHHRRAISTIRRPMHAGQNARLATQIGGEWVFWQTGKNDLFVVLINLRRTIITVGAGWIVILVAAVLAALYWRRRVRSPTAPRTSE